MRDRGIRNPGMKAKVCAALLLGGAVAMIWGYYGAGTSDESSLARTARPLGIAVMIAALLMLLNYHYASRLVLRMHRGEGVIGRWQVSPAALARFGEAERTRKGRRNNWKLSPRRWPDGLPVIFSSNGVLVGDTYFTLFTRGISRFIHVQSEAHPAALIDFSMRLKIVGAGTLGQTARYRGSLRIPVADDAMPEAAYVVARFRQLVG